MSYTVPNGETLGEVLGLRHGHAGGIATRQNPDGTWELVSWPAGLGSAPTQHDVTTWAGEAGTRRTAEKRARVKASLRGNEPDTVRLRAIVKVLLTSLVQARQTCNDLRAAMVNAASLADLKTRATAVGILPNRDYPQALDSVDALIDAGQGEE